MTTDATLEMIMGMGFPIGIPIPIGNPMGIAWELVTKLGMGMERNGPCEKKSFPIISTQHCSISTTVSIRSAKKCFQFSTDSELRMSFDPDVRSRHAERCFSACPRHSQRDAEHRWTAETTSSLGAVGVRRCTAERKSTEPCVMTAMHILYSAFVFSYSLCV